MAINHLWVRIEAATSDSVPAPALNTSDRHLWLLYEDHE